MLAQGVKKYGGGGEVPEPLDSISLGAAPYSYYASAQPLTPFILDSSRISALSLLRQFN